MLEFAKACSARRLIAPLHSYPGYVRICKAIGAHLDTYADTFTLEAAISRSADVETILVLTEPGNPVDIVAPRLSTYIGENTRLRVLVDVAYMAPFGDGFRACVSEWLRQGAAVCFTLSKLASLAGVRLGGVIMPPTMVAQPSQDQRLWDLLAVAVVEAFSCPDVVASALEVCQRQEALGVDVEASLVVAGSLVVGRGGGCFVTVSSSSLSRELAATLKGKRFGNAWTRVDVSENNAEILRRHVSEPRT